MNRKSMSVAPDPQRRLVTLDEAREQLGGLSRGHLYELFARGDLKPVKLGRRTFIASDDLARYIAELVAA